jgi:uncharacterized protein YndB with AHSA1/START domain
MWFDVEPTDLSFVDAAPFIIENEAVINASPERVFEVFSTGEGQIEWFRDFKATRWLSEAPHGVGSTREIELKTLTVKERFVAWEPGRRLSFTIYAITLPLVTAMLEDLHFEPMGPDRTRLRWRVNYRPSVAMRLVHPVARSIFGEMFSASTAGIARYATDRPVSAGPLP